MNKIISSHLVIDKHVVRTTATVYCMYKKKKNKRDALWIMLPSKSQLLERSLSGLDSGG